MIEARNLIFILSIRLQALEKNNITQAERNITDRLRIPVNWSR